MNVLKTIYRVFFLERRLPYGWVKALQKFLYHNALHKTLNSIVNTPPIPCSATAKVEVHVVTCKRDLYMAVFALKSLLRFYDQLAVVIHGDESFDDKCCQIFLEHIPNCRIISVSVANQFFQTKSELSFYRKKLPDLFRLGSEFEQHRKAWALKVFDFHVTSKTEKLFVLDSDTLFIQKPDELIDWIENQDSAFYALPYAPNLMVNKELYLSSFPKSRLIDSFNGGFFGFSLKQIPIELLIDVVRTIETKPQIKIFGDECIWRFVFGMIDASPFDYYKYPLFGMKKRYLSLSKYHDDFKYIHFLLKHNGGLYNRYAKKVLKELETNIVAN